MANQMQKSQKKLPKGKNIHRTSIMQVFDKSFTQEACHLKRITQDFFRQLIMIFKV